MSAGSIGVTPCQRDGYVAEEIQEIREYLRIGQELCMDQLFNCSLDDVASVRRTTDRLNFILTQVPAKLEELGLLIDEVRDMRRVAA